MEFNKDNIEYNSPVMALLNESRKTYGLRHNDYFRYRKYCSRKLLRLRKALNFTQKGKPTKDNKITDELRLLAEKKELFLEDIRYFHLLLFECERSWSYAMDDKSKILEEPRKKQHLISRLKKAVSYANFIEQISKCGIFKTNGLLEVKAYSNSIRGYYYFEKEDWASSLKHFTAVKIICETLAQAENISAQDKALYFSIVDEIEPNMRFCAYVMNYDDDLSDQVQAMNDLTSKVKVELLNDVKDKLEGLPSAPKANGNIESLNWFGNSIDMRSSEIIRLISVAKDAETNLNSNSISKEVMMSTYDKIILSYADSANVAQKLSEEDKFASEKIISSKSAELSANLRLLKSCVEQRQLSAMILRNMALVKEHYTISNQSSIPQITVSSKIVDIIRLIDGIIESLNQMTKISMFSEEYEYEQWLNARINYFKGSRFFFIGNDLYKHHKYFEACVLFGYALNLFTESIACDSQAIQTDYILDQIAYNDDTLFMEKITRSLFQQARAGLEDTTSNQSLDTIIKGVKDLNINDNDFIQTVFSQIQNYPNFKKVGDITKEKNLNQLFYPALSDLPIKSGSISTKPMAFDLAYNSFNHHTNMAASSLFNNENQDNLLNQATIHMDEPSNHIEEPEASSSGVLGNLFSFFKN